MGLVKKVALSEFSNPRKIGIIAINLNRGDRLVDARLTDGTQDLIIGTRKGMAIRFNEKDIRPMGRQATGVRGVKLEKGDEVIGSCETTAFFFTSASICLNVSSLFFARLSSILTISTSSATYIPP